MTAWGWVEHLRSGGTTPWSSYVGVGTERGRFVPGAQQLELLRRLNVAGRPDATLVERVVAASAPGRGRPDLELVGAQPERRFGPRPVDPGTLPDAELLRVATGLLAADLASVPLPDAPAPRRWRRRYELVGDPYVATAWTDHLTDQGRPPGGAGRAVLVVGTDLPTLLAHAWMARCLAGGGPSWADFTARARLPRRVDLPAVAERQTAREHTGRVSVVLDPSEVARAVGVRSLPRVPSLSASAGELARQVGLALSLLVTPPEQARRLRTVLAPRLAGLPGPAPAVPTAHRDWVEDEAARLHRALTRATYPVVGDPEAVMPRWRPLPEAGPTPLDLAIRLLLEER